MGRTLKIAIGITAAVLTSWIAGNFIFIPGTFQKNRELPTSVRNIWSKTLSLLPVQSVPTPAGSKPTEIYVSPTSPASPNASSSFAVCLRERGLKMYGTKTCPNCKNQKALFGEDVNELTLIDCDEQAALCKEKSIRGYPTWEFPDGRMIGGVIPLEYFAKETGCSLP